jgi:hypothetical protein
MNINILYIEKRYINIKLGLSIREINEQNKRSA